MNRKIWNRQMLILLTATFFYMTCLLMVGPIMAGYSGSLGATAVMMGTVAGMSNFTSLFCRPFVGPVIDSCNRRIVGMLGLAAMAIGAAVCAAAPSVGVLLLGRVFTGAGFAVSSGTLSTWVASSLPRDHIGQGMGIYGMVQAVSQAMAPAFGLAVAERFNYRLSCAAASACALAALLLLLPLRDAHYAALRKTNGARKPRSVRGSFIKIELLPIALIIFLFCIPYNGTSSFLATMAADRGLPFSVGSFFTIFAIFMLVVRLVLSGLLDRIPFRRFVVIAVPFGVTSMLCLHWMQSFGMMVLAAFFLTFAYGMMQPVCQSAGVRSVRPEEQGVANCTYYIGLDLGLAVGPALSGALYGAVGEGSMFLVLSLVPMLSLAVLIVCKRIFDRLGL